MVTTGQESRNPSEEHGVCLQGYTEQDRIDLLLGKTEGWRRQTLERHAAGCAACSALSRDWSALLAEGTEEADKANEPLELSPRLRASLEKEVRWIGLKRKLRRWTLVAAVPVTAALLLLSLFANGSPEVSQQEPYLTYVERQEPEALKVVQATDTARYRIIAPSGRSENGYLWLSGDSSEAFLLLDHLAGLHDTVYQAWAVVGDRSDSLGLVKLIGERGHLHVKTETLRTADIISLSAEPVGGSLQPTSRQIVLLLLQNR